MKNSIKLSAIIIFTILMMPVFQGCEKYVDGPSFSFKTRAERISSRWEVENYKINDNDYTSLVSNYSETFSKNGDYSYSWSIGNGSGTWVLQNNDMEIQLSGSDNRSSRTLFIQKLEEKSFWYYYMDGNDKHEFHMISN